MHGRNGNKSTVVSVVLPTYNEAANLQRMVERVRAALQPHCQPFEIIIVDDNSPDGTGQIADECAATSDDIRVVHRKDERGLATAILAGFRTGQGEVLAVMDADLQHPPMVIAQLVAAVQKGADIAVASRYARGGSMPRWSLLRKLVSRVSTLVTRLVLPGTVAGISDPLSGCFAVRRTVIEGAELNPIGFRMLLEVLGTGHYSSVDEVPYTFSERAAGTSKLGLKTALQDAFQLVRLAWRTRHLERFGKFALVGLSGVGTNVGLLALLRETTSLSLSSCGALAVGGSIVSNFVLNEHWTFSDWTHSHPGMARKLSRFARYALVCAGGGLLNVATLLVLNHWVHLHYLISDIIGIGLAMSWNYGWNANFTWCPAKNQSASEATKICET